MWTNLGISLGLAAAYSVVAASCLVGWPLFEEHRQHLALGLGGLGLLLLILGSYLASRRKPRPGESGNIFVLADLRFWGPMLAVLGAITLYIQTLGEFGVLYQQLRAMFGVKPVVVAALEPKPKQDAEPVKPTPAPPVRVPVLKIQGLIFREGRSVVFFNGRSYSVGDKVGEAHVKEITRTNVTLETSNEVQVISLESSATPPNLSSAGK